jgi:cephalosporin hydroxylase
MYQQLIFRAKPNVIIETGVAKGGSILFACQMLDLLHGREKQNHWRVICSDINSLEQAEDVIYRFGYTENVFFFHGDSASLEFQNVVQEQLMSVEQSRVLVSLDSNHTEHHVWMELQLLAPFVSLDSYVVIWDSRLGDLSRLTHYLRPRAWNRSQHAGSGVSRFLKFEPIAHNFEICNDIERSLLLSGTKNGVLIRRK